MKAIETIEDCIHTDCIYRATRPLRTGSCDYILIEGHSRGCKISECDKYVSNKDKHLKIKMNRMYDLIRYAEDYEEDYEEDWI